MEIIRGLHNIRPAHRGCVATIGNFDGLHLGHQAVLGQVLAHARLLGVPALVTLFEPQPREYFEGAAAPARLTRLREKCELLAELGIDRVLCARFDARLAGLAPDRFIERLLVDGLGVRVLVVGEDFRFGRSRAGDAALLRGMGARHGFEVVGAVTHLCDGERVSSTRVRAALAGGDLELVRRLLGRRYSLSGRVVHGDKRGREIGFPTANVALHRHAVPVSGIFAVRVAGLQRGLLPGVAYVGTRPVVGGARPLLEVHLFDYDADCYGRHIRVELLAKIRDDLPFASFAALRGQIERDAQRARELLAAAPALP